MNRRWIAVAIIIVAVIGLANIFILTVLVPRWTKSTVNSPPPPPPAAPAAAAVAVTAPANPPAAVVSASVAPATNTVAAAQPAKVARPRPTPRPVQAGLHLEREVLAPSGKMRIEYMRDRQQGVRQIVLQDSKNPSNSTVLAQYKRNAWAVVSPDDEWVVLNSRDGAESGAQLYHRVSAAPLKYEVPEELRANSAGLQDVVWENYLGDTQQDENTDRKHVTIDAIAWQPDSHHLSISVAPIATKDDAALPEPWTCTYDVTTKQIEPPSPTQGPADDSATAVPNDNANAQTADAQSDNTAAADSTDAAPQGDETAEMEGEKFPATREEPITMADANELELSDIRYAINEMFARHGANFKDNKIKKTFSEFSWYQPRTDVTLDDVEAEFSDVEKQNIAVLRRCRDAKLAAARRSGPKPIRGERVEEESDGQKVLRGVLQGVSDALNGGN